jgi:hypothetical protein
VPAKKEREQDVIVKKARDGHEYRITRVRDEKPGGVARGRDAR